MWKKVLLLSLFIIGLKVINAQIFTKVESNLVGVMQPVTTWYKYGGSNKLSAYLAGDYYRKNSHYVVSQTNTFVVKHKFRRVLNNLPALYAGDADNADFDGDGNEDIIATGITSDNQLIMSLYHNNGGNSFTKINQRFTPTSDGSVEWGDYDNDEDLDILVTGKQFNNQLATFIYRNDNGIFSKKDVGIPGVYNGNATWGDYDNDGDLDILITGNAGGKPYTDVYENANGKFSSIKQQFIPLKNSAGDWGDLDNDGYLDFIVSGETASGYPVCVIYQNKTGSFFKQVAVSIRPLQGCSIDLGDYDNDNDLDILMTGESLERSYTDVYENQSGLSFENINAGLPGVADGNALWGDYDHDGDLDILLAGLTICYDFVSDIYINSINPPLKKEVVTDNIFIHSPMPDSKIGPYYYYIFASCYCDPMGGGNNAYHMYVSNVHLQHKRYELNYKFNELLVKSDPNWGNTDSGYRTSNGFKTKKEADISRKQVIESYKSTNFMIHKLNW